MSSVPVEKSGRLIINNTSYIQKQKAGSWPYILAHSECASSTPKKTTDYFNAMFAQTTKKLTEMFFVF